MDHEPDLAGLDLGSVRTVHEFALMLRRLHARAGKPPYREIERQAERRRLADRTSALLPRASVSEALNGKRLLGRDFVAAFVTACGVPAGPALRDWLVALGRVAENDVLANLHSPAGPLTLAVTEAPLPSTTPARPLLDPTVAVPPTIGGVSRPSRSAWRLPARSAQSSLEADQARFGPIEIRAASVVGPYNRSKEPATPRQDSFRLGRDSRSQYLIAATADGLSSSRCSDIGANIAVAVATSHIREHIDSGRIVAELNVHEVFRAVSEEMLTMGSNLNLQPIDLGSTLMIAAIPIHPGEDGMRLGWFGWLAGLSVWTMSDLGWERIVGGPDTGQFANQFGAILPLHPAAALAKLVAIPPRSTVAMVSDGIAVAFETIGGAANWFAERWRMPPPLASFILDVDFEARGCGDDRTAVVMWCDRPADEVVGSNGNI